MSKNLFKRGELYSVINAMAVTEVNRKLQKNFRNAGIEISIEQWSILYHLWKQDGLSQQDLSIKTNKDKASITRLLHNLEDIYFIQRKPSLSDKRINNIFLTQKARDIEDTTIEIASNTLSEALTGISKQEIDTVKDVMQRVYDNLTA